MNKTQNISAAAIEATRTLAQALNADNCGHAYTEITPRIFCALLIERAIDRLTSALKENTSALELNTRAVLRAGDINPDAKPDDDLFLDDEESAS